MQKEATLKLTLKADSGYSSREEARISTEQWDQIQRIISVNGKAEPNTDIVVDEKVINNFMQSGYAAMLLEIFWQRTSDACPLDVTERDNQLNKFEEWLKTVGSQTIDEYKQSKQKS